MLTIRMAIQVLLTDSDLAEDLLALAHSDARQIIEDADHLIVAVRSNSPALWQTVNDLAERIQGELAADDDAEEREAPQEDE